VGVDSTLRSVLLWGRAGPVRLLAGEEISVKRRNAVLLCAAGLLLIGGMLLLSPWGTERPGALAALLGMTSRDIRAGARTDPIGPFDGFRPTADEIAAELGEGRPAAFDDDRQRRFADLFRRRFRDRQHAVGVRFLPDGRIKAMFAPSIPRWDMARVAISLHEEARRVFGRTHDVDIYETYITMPMKKLAEVRADPGTGRLKVWFDPRFAEEEMRKRRRLAPRRSLPSAAYVPFPPHMRQGFGPPAARSIVPDGRAPQGPVAGAGRAVQR